MCPNRNHRPVVCLLFLLSAFVTLRVNSSAQVRPVNDYGALGIGRLLKQINTTASVMMIGAHPDDEDSALIAYLARGENARTAYLSLTRGDGGQNIIGPELFESLGVIRTEELLQARRLDGAEQYFTRAFDYGFSKTLAEAKSKWDEKVVLCDAVKVIRMFRPLVVISRFTGTSADGHGQHQFAGYISPLAVKAAADASQCLGDGGVWQVKKFYIETGFNSTAEPTLRVNTGTYDPLLGRSYFEIAMEGRSMHRSQGEGRIEFRGEQYSGLNLADAAKDKRETNIFEGIETSVKGIDKLSGESNPALTEKLSILAAKIDSATRSQLLLGGDAAGAFAEIHRLANDALQISKSGDTYQYLSRIKDKAAAAIQIAAGIQIDALADRETVALGETVPISVRSYFPAGVNAKVKNVWVRETCHGVDWGGCGAVHIENAEPPPQQTGGRRDTSRDTRYFKATPTKMFAYLTQPFWLRTRRSGDMFHWGKGMVYQYEDALPFSPPPVVAQVTIEYGGIEFTVEKGIEYRYADPSRGEIRRELNIVPPVTIKLDRDVIIVPYSEKPQVRRVVLTVTNNSNGPASGKVAIGSSDWKTSPTDAAFDLKNRDESVSVPFDLTIPAKTSADRAFPYNIHARVLKDATSISPDHTMHVVAYPHTQTHRYYTSPQADLRVIDLKAAPSKVGYIMGSGDEVPEAIRQMGMTVTMLEEKDLASGDLSKFDTIVVGVRASETRPDMMSNKARLLEYVTAGGNLLVQYQRGGFANSGLPPYPVTTADTQRTAAGSIARVVDENAPVKILVPSHPVFTTPNKIADEDFKGWVQERNAYNLVTFDAKYTGLLESHDAGEQPNNGGLVTTTVGKGTWTYCSYSFFRQLPAGVPGAYRLFANLLSRPRGK